MNIVCQKLNDMVVACNRSFSVSELKILIDAIQAASFVTNKKTAELIEKIANLGGQPVDITIRFSDKLTDTEE